MSAAAASGGPNAGANGSAGTANAPAPASGAPGAGGSAPSGQDYLGKIRADSDFAVSQVREHQSRADKLEAENRALKERFGGKLSTYVEKAGADTVARIVERFEQGLSDPQAAPVLKAWYESGQFRAPGPARPAGGVAAEPPADDLDDYDPVARRVRQLESRLESALGRIESGLGATIQSTGKAAVESHLRRFRSDLHLTDEEFREVADKLGRQVDQWGQTPDGRSILTRLSDPSAYESVRTIAMGFVPMPVLEQLGERKRLQSRNRVAGFETDGPSRPATTGAEPPADLASRTPGEVLKFFKDNPHFLGSE